MNVRTIPASEAAQRLVGFHRLDPRGMAQPDDVHAMTAAGRCYALEHEGAEAVMVLGVRDGCVWVDALIGAGPVDITAMVDELLTKRAAEQGVRELGCQTMRPGLVRKLKARGWRVVGELPAGWSLRKELQ